MAPHRSTVVLLYQRVSLPWIFQGAQRAGIDLVLVPRPDERIAADRLPPGVVRLLPLDIEADPRGAMAELRRQHAHTPFDGITTLYDPLVPFAADAAAALGLPGLAPDAARAVQDKRLMRERLRAAGLHTPGFVALDGPEEIDRAAGLDFPVVVKPAQGFSSLGVTKAESPKRLRSVAEQVGRITRTKLGGASALVVEEYVEGPELAVESLAHQGHVRVLTVGYKGEPVGPHFEESVYRAPAPLPSAVRDAVLREVTAAHAALGVSDGPTHTELRLRGGRTPYLLELGARIGGSGVSHYIAERVTGVDLAAESLRIAAGLPPAAIQPAERGAAANYIVPCGGSGRITAIHGLDELRSDPRVDHLVQMLFPGDVVRPYPDFSGYPAFVLSHHPSAREAEEFHGHLERSVRIAYGR